MKLLLVLKRDIDGIKIQKIYFDKKKLITEEKSKDNFKITRDVKLLLNSYNKV